jgi:hypothetical protein
MDGEGGAGGTLEQPPSGGQDQGTDAAGQYAGYLKDVPEQFHGQLLDGFKRTDQYWQQQLQQAQSRYAPFEPLTQRYEPQYLSSAATILDEIQQNPAQVLPWLAEQFGVQLGAGTQGGNAQMPAGDQGQGDDWTTNVPPQVLEKLARLDQLEQIATLTGQTVLEQQQQKQQEEELALFDQHLQELRNKYGEYDEDWVLTRIATRNELPEDAVKAYLAFEQQVAARTQQRRVPTLLSANGGMPSNQIDPLKLNPKDTRSLIADLINQANTE